MKGNYLARDLSNLRSTEVDSNPRLVHHHHHHHHHCFVILAYHIFRERLLYNFG